MLLTCLVLPPRAVADTLYWDNFSGNSSWANLTNWSKNANNANNSQNPTALPGIADIVIFNITSLNNAQTINLDGNHSVGGMTFNSTGTTRLQGGGTGRMLTLGSSGIIINAVAGAVDIGSTNAGQQVNLILNAEQTWENNSTNQLNVWNNITNNGALLRISKTGNIVLRGTLSGSGGLTKFDSGTLTLTGSNAYTGATTIEGGTLALSGGGSLADGGLVDLKNSTSVFNLSGLEASSETIGTLTGVAGSTVMLGAKNLTLSGNSSTTFDGVLSGSGGSLTKAGTGTLTLTGNNTFTGPTIISNGTLALSSSGALADSSALQLTGATAVFNLSAISGSSETIGSLAGVSGSSVVLGSKNLTVGGHGSNTTFAGILSGSGSLTKTGLGALTLSGNNTYSGASLVNQGTVLLGSGTALGSSNSMLTVASGATLDLNGQNLIRSGVATVSGAGSGSGAVVNFGIAPSTLNAQISFAAGMTIGGTADIVSIRTFSGTGTLTKVGTNTLALATNNTFTGGSILSAGTLLAQHNNALGAGTLTLNGGKLASDNDTRSLGNALLVTNTLGGQVTGSNSLVWTGVAAGAGTLEIQFLNATKSLRVNPASSNTFAPAQLKVTSGTLLLGAANRIANTTALHLAGGTFNTGGFSETMGVLTLSANSVLDMGAGASVLNFANSSSAPWSGTLSVWNWTGFPASNDPHVPLGSGNTDRLFFGTDSTGLSAGQLAQIQFFSDAGGTLLGAGMILGNGQVIPTPEPATWLGLSALVGCLFFRERRRLRTLLRFVR